MLRGWKPLLAIAGAATVAGCSTPEEPQVTFYSHGDSVAASPVQYCDPAGQECKEPAEDATEQLSGTADSPLQISVPADVADTPWQVVFVYEDADGNEVDSRSPVFSPGERYAYTLHLPDDAAELRHVEVQRFSAVLTAGPEGGVDFGIGGSWVVEMN